MLDDKPIGEVRVADVLEAVEKTVEPATVSKDANLREAVKSIIKDSETRKVYVLDEEGKIVGTITLEVLLRHAGYRFGVRSTGMTSFIRMLSEITDEKVTTVMQKPIKVSKDELLLNVMKLMVENHLNDLPVVDEKNRLVAELNGIDILRLGALRWS